MTYSRYGSAIVTGEASYMLFPKSGYTTKTPAILAFHNATGNALFCDPIRDANNGNHYYLQKLADKGFVIISNPWTGDPYGASALDTAADQAYTWAQTNAKPGPVGIYGWSAGAANGMNWFKRNPTKVGAMAFSQPSANLTNLYADNAALQAGMDAAYAGNFAANGTSNSPHLIAASLPVVPRLIWYSTSDSVIRPADSTALAASLNTEPVSVGASHTALTSKHADPAQLVSVFDQGLR